MCCRHPGPGIKMLPAARRPARPPGPVGEEGCERCVRLSSGRTRLPGRVPAPPRARASPVESNGRGVPLRREDAGRSRPRTLTTPLPVSILRPKKMAVF